LLAERLAQRSAFLAGDGSPHRKNDRIWFTISGVSKEQRNGVGTDTRAGRSKLVVSQHEYSAMVGFSKALELTLSLLEPAPDLLGRNYRKTRHTFAGLMKRGS
jgi:hypothetical protein